MLTLLRLLTRALELGFVLPLRLLRALVIGLAFNPRLGPLRYVAIGAMAFGAFAVVLVYVVAPLRGYIGGSYQSAKLRYDAERWLATAIYDSNQEFVGTFDPRLDSVRDVNYTGERIELGGYVANPDHKSIPVREVPPHYWDCLIYHEDRRIGTWLNPFGIDLIGVLKIPYSSLTRSLKAGRIRFGVGGSTLPMQLARVIYKTPPGRRESGWEKLGRKLGEWWLAPVIHRELTRGGDYTPLKRWTADHLWFAQRTGGAPLNGVELTSRIVFAKEARALTRAEQYVLASAVNKPIILLEGSEQLNAVRLDRWRYVAEVRARRCAEALVTDPEEQRKTLFELVNMAGGPPNPQIEPGLGATLQKHAAQYAERARANPIIRANVLMPSARFGLREEMKQLFGYEWRNSVRGIATTLDVSDNLSFHAMVRHDLDEMHKRWGSRLYPGFTLDARQAAGDPAKEMPQVIVVAADSKGRIVRYYENSQFAPYFGSLVARKRENGGYIRALEPRQIASTGKMLAAIAIANSGRDSLDSLYLDVEAPDRGLETCQRNGNLRRGRRAIVAFACSLNGPIENRTASLGQDQMRSLIDAFGFNMPPAPTPELATPPTTAAVRGLIAGSPRQVHQMAAAILAGLTGQGRGRVYAPSLVEHYEFTSDEARALFEGRERFAIIPDQVIGRTARSLTGALLGAPLCYTANGRQHGTLKDASDWCASRRRGVRLHFAKTGTAVTLDPDATVDTWVAGGIQFESGAAYSYVVVVGSGSASQPFASRLHSSQLAVPLMKSLLTSLEDLSRRTPAPQRGVTATEVRLKGSDDRFAGPIQGIWERLLTNGQ